MDFRFRWKSGLAADINAMTEFDPNRTFLRPHLKRSTHRALASIVAEGGSSAPSSILRASRQDALTISSG
jgi:hypothetical protein